MTLGGLMTVVEQATRNEAPQPIILDETLARNTTRILVGRLEVLALASQAIGITFAAYVDPTLGTARSLLLILAAGHAIWALSALRFGGPFLRGGPQVVTWLGLTLLLPIYLAVVAGAGKYGADPTCVQLCAYPAPPLVLFAFYPWLSAQRSYLRPGSDIALLAVVTCEPLFIIWQVNGFVSTVNAWAVAGGAAINMLAYALGLTLGKMCRTAAEDQLRALRRAYHRLFHYLHGQAEITLASINLRYAQDRKDQVL